MKDMYSILNNFNKPKISFKNDKKIFFHKFNINTKKNEYFKNKMKEIESKYDVYETNELDKNGAITFDEYASSLYELYSLMLEYKHDEIEFTILNTFSLNNTIQTETKPSYLSNFIISCVRPSNNFENKFTQYNNNLLIHFHGGGFSTSSEVCESTFLKAWASKLNIPIISVEYRKSPDEHFPVSIEECYQTYKWIVKNYTKIFFGKLKKIILSGDCTGANLALAVISRAIFDNIRLPTALVMAYPIAQLNTYLSSSRILTLYDPLTNYMFLKYSLESYVHHKNINILRFALFLK
jgi:hypothetical protein